MTEKHSDLVLITGSSGLIGYHLALELAKNYTVVGFDQEGPPHPPDNVDCIFVDLRSDESVQQAVGLLETRHGSKVASVVHLAAYYNFSGEPSDLYEQVTVQGTHRLLRELRHCKVEQFIFSSSMLVHSPCTPGQLIDEDSPLDPKWDYPISKAKTEELILKEHGDIPAVILRIAGVYDANCHSIPLANQIQRIYENKLVSKVFPGDISHGQSFIHLRDLIKAIRLVIEKRLYLPEELTLLLGEPKTLSYEYLQRAFAELIHDEKDWPTVEIPKAMAKLGAWFQDNVPAGEEPFIKPWMVDLADDHYELDISKAKQYLGWKPAHSLQETLPIMIRSLKKDPLKFYRDNRLSAPYWLKESA